MPPEENNLELDKVSQYVGEDERGNEVAIPDEALLSEIQGVRESLKQFEQIFSGFDVRDASQIKGEDGYTPVKGEDYMTPQDIEEMTVAATPVVGEDYFTPEQIDRFLRQVTPVAGEDYFTSDEIQKFKEDIRPRKDVDYFDGIRGPRGRRGKPGEKGKDGTELTSKELSKKIGELKGNDRIPMSAIKDFNRYWNSALFNTGGVDLIETYIKQDGSVNLTGVQNYDTHPTFTDDTALVDKKYVDDSVSAAGGYTDEDAQDAVGTILADSAELDFTYDDATPSITAILKSASITKGKLASVVQDSLDKADSATQPGDLATVATSGAYSDLSGTPDLSVYDNFEPYTNQADFPATGSADVIYLETSTGTMYRWTGSTYETISAKLALGETQNTAYRGDRGKIAYDHSQVTTGNPHNIAYSDLGGTLPGHTHDLADITDSGALAGLNAVDFSEITPMTENADGFEIAGGTTSRKLTVTGGDITLDGSGTVADDDLLVGNAANNEFQKTAASAFDASKFDLSTLGTIGYSTATSAFHDNGNSGTSVTIDANNGRNQTLTLTGDATISFSNLGDGQSVNLHVEHNGSTQYTPSLSGVRLIGSIDAGPASGETLLIAAQSNGTNTIAQGSVAK